MEKYFGFNEKALRFIGVNMSFTRKRYEIPLKIFVSATLPIVAMQNLLHIVFKNVVLFDMTNAMTLALYAIMGCFKFYTVVWHQQELSEIKMKLMGFYGELEKNRKLKTSRRLNLYRRITSTSVLFGFISTSLFVLIPIVVYVSSYLSTGVGTKITTVAWWYPFDKMDYFWPTFLWETVACNFSSSGFAICDGLIILLLGLTVEILNNFGLQLCEMIDKLETPSTENIQDFKVAIDRHNEILKVIERLTFIYQTPLLVNILVQTTCIGMVTFMVSVSLMQMQALNCSRFEHF